MDLQQAAQYWNRRLNEGKPIYRVRVRRLLELAGAERRGEIITQRIIDVLRGSGLTTEPDFATAWIDGLVTVRLLNGQQARTVKECRASEEIDPAIADASSPNSNCGGENIHLLAELLNVSPNEKGVIEVQVAIPEPTSNTPEAKDPIRRVGSIASANRGVVSVGLQDALETATTRMALNGYSQLAIMQGEMHVRGIISWESIAKRTLREPSPTKVSECRVDAQVIGAEASLSEALPTVEEHGYVLVKAQGKITGILTASDVVMELRSNSYAFSSISVIEGLIRRKLHPLISKEEMQLLADDSRARQQNDIRFATFGENIRLLQREAIWERMRLKVDKKQLIARLDSIREIRNDVMHFNSDALESSQKRELEQMEEFLTVTFV